jgi:hypothetical protein
MKTNTFLIRSIFFFFLFTNNLQAQTISWVKNTRGASTNVSNSIAVDLNGNVYTTGMYSGNCDFDPGSGVFNLTAVDSNDVFVTKSDASGNLVWAISMGGSLNDLGVSIAVDDSENVYVTGNFQGTSDFDPDSLFYNLISFGTSDIFIAKYNSSGDLVWAKQVGGSAIVYVYKNTLDPVGNVIVCGGFGGTMDFDPGSAVYNLTSAGGYDGFILKLTGSGDFVWAGKVGGTVADFCLSMVVDATGNIYTTGSYNGTADFDPDTSVYNLNSAGFTDIFILKINSTGNLVWVKDIGSSGFESGECIAVDAAGNICISGNFAGTVDFDPGTGSSTLTATGSTDNFVVKLDSSGLFSWAKSMGGSGYVLVGGLTVDAGGNVFTTGRFNSTSDFDPGSNIVNLGPVGLDDIYLSKLDMNGNFSWAFQLGAARTDKGNDITSDQSGNVYLTGVFNDTVDFDPGAGITSLHSANNDFFYAKYSDNPTNIYSINNASDFVSIYPNPSSGLMHVSGSIEIEKIMVVNSEGRIIYFDAPEAFKFSFELKERGIYFIQLLTADGQRFTKMVTLLD